MKKRSLSFMNDVALPTSHIVYHWHYHIPAFLKDLALNVLIDKLQRLAIIETSVQSEVADLIASLPLPPRFIVSSVGDADSCTGVNDKLQKLKDEVLGLLRRKSDSRVLIFVQERYASMALLDWFSKDADLARLNPVRLSGQAKTSAGGLTSSAAKANLERFASGNSKVMITTSVAEEGVDIPQCNLVIRFQYVKDEVGLVQVRGRCRSKESDCVLIYDSANEALALKDKENEIRNDLMEKAIEELCAMDEETFKKRVAKHQAEIFPAESASASAENPTSLQSMDSGIGDDRAWQVLCGYCQALVAHHTRILRACGSHHIVVDENVYDRVCARLLAKPRSVGDTELIGDCMCKNCWSKKVDEKKLGKIIRIGSDQKRLFALLSAEDICFRAPGSEKIIIFKKWKDAKDSFEIRDANNEDLNAFLERTKDRKFLPLDAPGK